MLLASEDIKQKQNERTYSVSEMVSYQGGLHSSGLSPLLFPEIVYFEHSKTDTLLRQ